MSTPRKLQLGGVFLLGSFVVAAGIARCVLSAIGIVNEASDLDVECEMARFSEVLHADQVLQTLRRPSSTGPWWKRVLE